MMDYWRGLCRLQCDVQVTIYVADDLTEIDQIDGILPLIGSAALTRCTLCFRFVLFPPIILQKLLQQYCTNYGTITLL